MTAEKRILTAKQRDALVEVHSERMVANQAKIRVCNDQIAIFERCIAFREEAIAELMAIDVVADIS